MEYGQSCSQKQVDVIFPYMRCRNVHLPLKIIIPSNVAELHMVCGHQLLAQTAGGEGGMESRANITVMKIASVLGLDHQG